MERHPLEGDLADSVTALKDRHERDLTVIVSGAGELARTLVSEGLVDEFWFWVSETQSMIGTQRLATAALR